MGKSKLLSVLLTCAMVFGLFSAQLAFAENEGEGAGAPPEQAGSLLQEAAEEISDAVVEDEAFVSYEETVALSAAESDGGQPLALMAITSEQELYAAVTGAPDGVATTVELSEDITLSGELIVSHEKVITLTGNKTLTGADGFETIRVDGNLTIDGITVTHTPAGVGIGVHVYSGSLTMKSGAITGNRFDLGGAGIYNYAGSVLIEGGSVSNNGTLDSLVEGGGIANRTGGTLTITGGEISGNKAGYGGAIYTESYENLTVSASAVFSGNTARAVYLLNERQDPDTWNVYRTHIDATSWTDSMTVGFNNYDINYFAESIDVTFDSNYAGAPAARVISVPAGTLLGDIMPSVNIPTRDGYNFAYWRFDAAGTATTLPDFAYLINEPTTLYAQWVSVAASSYVMTVTDSYGAETGAGSYEASAIVTVDAGAREGYTFSGWTVTTGDVTLADATSAVTTFTMPTSGVSLRADWTAIPDAPVVEEPVPAEPTPTEVAPEEPTPEETNPEEPTPEETTVPRTGDDSGIVAVTAVTLLLLTGMALILIRQIKDRRRSRRTHRR